MNGTVVFGVALIIMALFFGGQWMLGLLIGGVVVAAFGAFGPSPKRAATRPLSAEDEPFV